jgi:hypothetical protein
MEDPAAGDEEVSSAATARFGFACVKIMSIKAEKTNLNFFITPLN